jgi:UDP-glucose 4-epimerase
MSAQPTSRGRAWVTGAHGFIGRYLAQQLARSGHAVYGLGHGLWPAEEARQWGVSDWTNGDISASNLEHMRQCFGLPDVVFHLAGGASVGLAMSNPHEDFRRTVIGTAELLEWQRQHAPSARLVAVSSAAVYGAGHGGAIAEDAPVSPFSPYGTHKFMMEEMCRSYAKNFGLHVATPRLFSVYGAGLKKQLLWDLCGKLQAGADCELGGSGEELRDWIDVRDVVQCLQSVAQVACQDAPIINIAAGVGTSVRTIAELVSRHWAGAGQSLRAMRFNGLSRPGDPFSLTADVHKMRSLGLPNRIALEQGLADYVAWFRSRAQGDI